MVSVVDSIEGPSKNKKIVFDDDGEVISKDDLKHKNKKKTSKSRDGSVIVKSEKNPHEYATNAKERQTTEDVDSSKKWYQVYPQYPATDEILDMKDSEQMELYNLCRTSYEQEKGSFTKQNPSDSRWLQTALHKGTAKDRANAGALLVTSNPLANLEALTALIASTKLSNKSCVEVIATICDLWKEVLLPSNRKLYSIQMRGSDWKLLRKSEITKEQQRKMYAYWHFENELKDLYFEFLKNLQQGIQTGQENNKTTSITVASKLLSYAPEKEQMLLTMLINKLGDPVAKVASKALHHLTEVAHNHPNMCGIIVSETEKLLFRNNVSERAQHFALCYLASIAPAGRSEVCTKLVNICFALFKVLVQKGTVNSRTMQAILRCLQKAIVDAKPAAGNTELLTKDMQDTIYRLVHLADVRVSIQTLGLLLQLVTVKTEKSDRFYNALYKKLLDLNLTTIGSKTAAQLLHILHRAIYIDSNVPRAKAFLKRFLQLTLCAPANMAAGCLIVIQKIHQTRKELCPEHSSEDTENLPTVFPKLILTEDEMKKFDSDGEEKYEDVVDPLEVRNGSNDDYADVKTEKTIPSWHHSKVSSASEIDIKTREMSASQYDPYHRVPTFAGAEFALQNELILLNTHYHPTIQVFAESIINNKRIDYYGDPLRDFGLAHFLERFSFKNPKKFDSTYTAPVSHKSYVAYGARGVPVKSLTKNNCSEEEMFIFNFLEEKRNKSSHLQKTEKSENSDDEDNLQVGDVDDDEFEDYLDGFFGKKKKSKKSTDEDISDAEELDFLKDLGGETSKDGKEKKAQRKKKSTENDDNDDDDIEGDWGDDDENADFEGSENSDDEEGSIDFDEDEDEIEGQDDNDGDIDNEADDDDMDDIGGSTDEDLPDAYSDDDLPSKSKKLKRSATSLDERSFAKKLKHSDDLTSLFAAADDFAELLEETGKTKGQGTSNAVFNKDKSTAKQLKWEEKRRSGSKHYGNKSKQKGKFSKRK